MHSRRLCALLVPLFAIYVSGTHSGDECLTSELAAAVLEGCQQPGTAALHSAVVRALSVCHQETNAGGLRIVLPDIFAKPWLQPTLAAFSSLHGVLLDIDVWPAVRLHEALVAEAVTGGGCITAGGCIADGSNSTAGAPAALLLHTVGSTHDLASGGILADLSDLVTTFNPDEIQWPGISQLFRLQLSTYMGSIVNVPLDGGSGYMLSRTDVLTHMGISEPPQSWTELLDFIAFYRAFSAAQQGSATAGSADGGTKGAAGGIPELPPYPLCLPVGVACKHLFNLNVVWTTIAQTHGVEQGVHFNASNDLEPLIDSPAAAEAFRVMAALLAAAAPPEPDEACTHGALGFARGKCALVVAGMVPQLKYFTDPDVRATVRQSDIRLSRLPGSELVWQRGGGSGAAGDGGSRGLVPCSTGLCPYGSVVTCGTPYCNRTRLINFAPAALLWTLTAGINSKAPFLAQLLAFEALSYLASPDRYGPDEPASPVTSVAPVRDQFTDLSGSNANIYTRAGYEPSLMDGGLAMARVGSRHHPNRAWPLRMAGSTLYNNVIQDLLSDVRASGITLSGLPASASPYYKAAAAAAEGWGSAGSVGAAPASGWMQSSSWAASLLVSSSGGSSGSDDDHVSTDYAGYADDDSAGGGVPDTISLEAALDAARNTLAAHYLPKDYLAKYLTSLGRSHLSIDDTGAAPGAAGDAGDSSGLMIIISVSLASVFFVMVAALLLVYQLRRNRCSALQMCGKGCKHPDSSFCGRRTSFVLGAGGGGNSPGGFFEGAASKSSVQMAKYAPEPHQPAVIAVTDIESSTQLWEDLPAEVMAAAMHLHHAAVRRLLLRHEGYESATEGDSFIAVFRSAHRAVMFGADLQTELVRQPWPQQLLEHPVCKPVHTLLPELYPFLRKKDAPVMSPSPTTAAAAPPPPQTQLGRQQSGAGGGVPPSSASQQQGLQQAALAARPALRSGGVDGASGGARGSAPSAAADMAAVGLMTSSLCYDDDFVTTAGAAQLATEVATWCDTTLTDMAAVAASHHGGGSNGGMQQSGRQQQQQQQQHSGSFKLVSRSSYCPGLASDSQQRLGRQCAPASPQLLQPSQQQSQQAAAADGSRGAGGSSAEANAALFGLRSYLAPPHAAAQPQLLHHPQCASAPPTLLQRNGAAAAAAALGSAAAYASAGRAVATAAADADEHSFTMDGGGSPDESSVAYAWFLASNGAAPPAAALETGLAAAAYSPTAAARPYAGGVGAAEAASRAAAEGALDAVGQQQPERSSLRRQHLASRLVRFFRRDPAASASALAAAAAAASAAGPSSMRTAPHGQAPHGQPAPAAGVTPEGLAGSGAAAYALARRNPSHLHSVLRSSTTSSLGGGSNPYALPRGSGAASQQLAAAAGTSDDDLFEVSLALAPVAEVAPSSTDGVVREHPAATAGGVTAAAAAGGALWRTAASRGLSTQDSHGTEPAACTAQQPLSPAVGLFISEAVGGFDAEDEIDDNQTMAFLATGEEGTPQSLGSCPVAGASSLYDSSRRRASGGPATSVAVAAATSSGSQQQHHAQQQPFAAPAVVAAQRLSEYFSAHREADLRHQQQGGGPMPPPPLAAAGSASKRPTSLVFRGLRVRVGMWAVPSLSPAELGHNAAAARLVVGGPCLAAAKALADMAHGGQVLLAGATEGALQQELRYLKLKSAAGSGGIALLRLGTYSDLGKHQAAAAAAKSAVLPTPEETALADLSLNVALERSQMQLQRLRLRSVHDRPAAEATASLDALVARAQLLRPQLRPQARLQQEALLDGGAAADAAAGQRRGATDVLCVVPAALSARLVHTPPLRVPATLGRISQVYDAPTASTSYLVVQVPKAAALLAWDVEVASESLRLLRDTAHRLLMAAPVRGYLVPSREDQIHVAFPAAAAVAALGFAEALRLALLDAPWPQALLEHELGEMVEVSACSIAPRMATQAPLVQASEAAAAVAAVSFADAAMLLHSPRPRGSPPPTLAPASAALPRLAVRKTPTTRPAAAPAAGYGAGAAGSASGWSLLRFFPASAGGAAAGADAAPADSDRPSLGAVSLPTTPAAATARRLIAAAASAFTTSRKVARWHSAANHRCGSSPAPVAQQPPVGVCQTAAGMLQHMTDASSQQHPLHARPMHMQHRAPIDVPGRMRLAYGSVASAGGMGETASLAVLAGANSDRLPVALAAERAELVLQEPRLAFTPLLLTAGLGLPENGGIMQQPQNVTTTGASEWPESWNSVGVLLGSSPPGVQVRFESNSLLAAARSPSRAGVVVGFDLGRGCESTSSGGMTWQQQLQGFAGSAAVEPVLGTVPLADLASNGRGNDGIAASCANDFGLNPARVAVLYSPPLGSAADPHQPASKQTTAEQWTLPAAAAAPAAERSAAAAGIVRSAGGYPGASNSDNVPQMQGNSHHGGWSSSVAAAAAGGWPSATTSATPPVSHCGGEGTKRRLQGHQSHVHLQPQPQQLQTMLLRGLRIRMGLATGAAEWRISRSAQALIYTGAAVVSATKLASSAACGQLLCDRATHVQAAAAARDEGALAPPPSLTWAAPAGLAPAVAAALSNPQPALLFSPLERWAGAPLKARKVLSGAQLCSFVSTSALPSAPNVRPLVEASGPAGLHSAPSGTDALRAPVLLSAFRPSETNLQSGSPAARAPPPVAAAEVEVELQQQHQQQQQQTRSAASLPSPLPHSMRRQSRLRLLTTACGTVHATDVSGSRPQQASAGHHPATSSTASNTASNTATGMASNTATLVTSTTSQSARPGLLSGNQSRTSSDLGQSTSRGEVEAPALASASDHRPPPPFAVVMPASGAAVSSAGQISSACVPPNLASSGMFMSANASTTASNYWGGMSMNARLASLPEVPERGASACQHDESCPASFVTDAAGIDRVAAGPAAAAPIELTTQSSSCQPQPGGSPRADVAIGGSPGTEPPPLLQRDSPAQQPAPVRNSSFDRTLPIRVFRALLRSSTSGPDEYAPASGGAAADTAAAAVVHPTRAGATLTNTTVAASGASVTRRLVNSQESFVGAAAGVAQQQPAAGSSLASPRLRRLSSARYQGGFDLLLSSAHSAASGMRRGGADTSGDVADMLRTHTGGVEVDSRSCSSGLHAQVTVGASNGGAAPPLRMPSFLRSSLPHPRVLLREGSYASPLGTPGGRGSLHALAGASTSIEVEAETAAAAVAVAAGAAGAGVRGDAAAAPHGDAAAATGAGAGIDKQEDPYEQRHPQQQQQQQQQQAMHEHAGLWSPFDASAVPCSPFLSGPPAAAESVVTRMKESSLAFWAAARSAGNAAGAGGAFPRLTSGMRAAGSLLLLPLRSSSQQSERPAGAELPRAASRQA